MAQSSYQRQVHKPLAEINVTPFVDVMLVLLIIFMVTSPMLISGVQVDLPETAASPMTKQEEPLSVTVNKKGEIFIQTKKVTLDTLGPKLQAILGEKKDTRIFVLGDKDIHYGSVMKVIGAIHQAGFTKVGLISDNEAIKSRS